MEREKELRGEWVGYLTNGAMREFIRLSFDESWCDLPQRKQLNLRVRKDASGLSFTVGDSLSFQGDRDQEGMSGRLNHAAAFHLWPVRQYATNPNQERGGLYQLDDGRTLHIFAQGNADRTSWQLFYRIGQQLVRLFPIGADVYLSERCDSLDFSGDQLAWKDSKGQTFSGSRLPWIKRERVNVPCQAGHTLAGSLLTPLKEEPHPVAILVHGAGPGYRDDYLGTAGFFLQEGIAVFIYDKRGWGQSTGEELWSEIFELADDLEEVIAFLETHPGVDGRRIGLCGYSNGGWVAPLAASRCEHIAFLISFSGCGVTPARQEQIRRCAVARDVLGASETQVARLEALWEHAFAFFGTGEWTKAFEEIVEQVENDAALQALPKHQGMPDGLQPVPPVRSREEWLALGGKSPDMLFDPLPVFADLDSPLLFVWGEDDTVVPVGESADAIAAGMPEGKDYSFLFVPNAGHQLFLFDQTITYAREIGDEIDRLKRAPRVYAPGAWDEILNWTLRHI